MPGTPLSSPPYLQFLEETRPHTGPTADRPSCIMRCRTTVGKHLLNLRDQLWPYRKHRSSCTIITSKQTAEESIFTKWHLSKRYSFITVRPDHELPRGGVWFETKAAQSKLQLQMDIHRISLLQEQLWSPDWPLESQNGLSMLGHSVLLRPIYFNVGRKAANNSKRERERGKEFWSHRVLGDKKDSCIWWSEAWFWQRCEIWLRKKRRQRDSDRSL